MKFSKPTYYGIVPLWIFPAITQHFSFELPPRNMHHHFTPHHVHPGAAVGSGSADRVHNGAATTINGVVVDSPAAAATAGNQVCNKWPRLRDCQKDPDCFTDLGPVSGLDLRWLLRK